MAGRTNPRMRFVKPQSNECNANSSRVARQGFPITRGHITVRPNPSSNVGIHISCNVFLASNFLDYSNAAYNDHPLLNSFESKKPVAEITKGGGTSAGENFDRFHGIKVHVTGPGVEDSDYHVVSFKEIAFGQRLQANILAARFHQPLPIQQYAIPYILDGIDVIGHSITGSGKSQNEDNNDLGHVESYPPQAVHPRALVLVPTHELAIQIADEFERFSDGLPLHTKLLYGGQCATKQQLAAMRNGCDILVATPGRLKNCIDRGAISMVKVKYFVLDEADEMLDKNFGSAIEQIVENGMPTKDIRQTLLFSATFPDTVQEMCDNYMKDDFVFITVGKVNSANSDITQELIKTTANEKMVLLLRILKDRFRDQRDITRSKILIFVASIAEANAVVARLVAERFPCNTIHRKINQSNREGAMAEFKVGSKPILVATSVAARGLDISNLDLVINYSLPQTIAEYVQRIGRTGRVGNKGRAIALYDPQKDHLLGDALVKLLKEASMTNTDQVVPRWLMEVTGREHGPSFLDD